MRDHTWSEELYAPGDAVWLRMDKSRYPAVITKVCDFSDTHRNGYRCRGYYADVTMSDKVHRDAPVNQCMLSKRT